MGSSILTSALPASPMNAPQNANPALAGIMLPKWVNSTLRGRAKSALRWLLCTAADMFDRAFGRSHPLVPPAALRVRVGCFLSFIRIGRYVAVGQEFAAHLRTLLKMQPDSRLLDIGCGCGQVAGALVGYLHGGYEGIDPDAEAIAWCQRNISAFDAGFRFGSVDLRNGYYNPQGTVDPDDWRIPFPNSSFDAVLLKSIFTHMLRRGMEQYVRDVGRVLKPGGRCLASAYVLNEFSEQRMRAGHTDLVLSAEIDGGKAFDAAVPEYIVGWQEETLRKAVAEAGLHVVEPILRGAWCQSTGALSYQDLIVLERRA